MTTTKQNIAGRLEQKFAESGFAEPSVSDLRDAADVSLRTLYRHYPSRDDMVIAALELRHQRYLNFIFDDLPEDRDGRLNAIFDRIGAWMDEFAPNGCLFQNALATSPQNPQLEKLLLRNREDTGDKLAQHLDMIGQEPLLRQIHEGAIQSWIFQQEQAINIARRLTRMAINADNA